MTIQRRANLHGLRVGHHVVPKGGNTTSRGLPAQYTKGAEVPLPMLEASGDCPFKVS
jgi:hypothetical protein